MKWIPEQGEKWIRSKPFLCSLSFVVSYCSNCLHVCIETITPNCPRGNKGMRISQLLCRVQLEKRGDSDQIKSMPGKLCAKVFVTDFDDVRLYPMVDKGQAHLVLSKYFTKKGVTSHLHKDNAWEWRWLSPNCIESVIFDGQSHQRV